MTEAPRAAAPHFSRRRFLASTAVLAAGGWMVSSCGSGDDEATPNLQALFYPSFVLAAGVEQRIPFGLIDQGIPISDTETEFRVRIFSGGGTQLADELVVARIVAHDHPAGNADQQHEHADLQRYFAVRATLDDPGIYDLELSFDGRSTTLPFQVFDAADVVVPLPGSKLDPLRFPTFNNPMDMDPICTQFTGPCPLHDKTIEEALATGRPLALLIATPQFCATAYCGPVLDVMLELQPEFDNIEFLHAEVYQNPNEVDGDLLDERLLKSPTVADLALPFEPTLFLLAPDRTIIDRIDNVYDNSELRQALSKL